MGTQNPASPSPDYVHVVQHCTGEG